MAEQPRKKGKFVRSYHQEHLGLLFRLVFPRVFAEIYTRPTSVERLRGFVWLSSFCRALRYHERIRHVLLEEAAMCYDHAPTTHFRSFRISDLWVRQCTFSDIIAEHFFKGQFHEYYFTHQWTPFEVLPGIGISNAMCIRVMRRFPEESFLCYNAPSFAAMCLFCYGVCMGAADAIANNISAYCVTPAWRVANGVDEGLLIRRDGREKELQKRLLGRLHSYGATTPISIAFEQGLVCHTEFSLYSSICDTSKKRMELKPHERLKRFLELWYPLLAQQENAQSNTPCKLKIQQLLLECF